MYDSLVVNSGLYSCPNCDCDIGLHYSSGGGYLNCLECSWVEGEPFEYQGIKLTLDEYMTTVGLLYKQIGTGISYLDYSNLISQFKIK